MRAIIAARDYQTLNMGGALVSSLCKHGPQPGSRSCESRTLYRCAFLMAR